MSACQIIAIIAIVAVMSCEPAKTVIDKCGGPQKVAEVTGRDVSRVYRWMYPRDRGGTGGIIPHDEATTLLAWAPTASVPLSPADFFAAVPVSLSALSTETSTTGCEDSCNAPANVSGGARKNANSRGAVHCT
jgi:hypothetical protein